MNRAGQRDTGGKEDVPDCMERILYRVETTRDDFWSSRGEIDMSYDGGSGEVTKVFRDNEQFQLAMDRAWSPLEENAVDAEPVPPMQGVQDSPVGEGSLLDGSETVMEADTEASVAREDGDKERWRFNRPEALRLSERAETSPTLGDKIREVGRRILSQREEFGQDGRSDCNKKGTTPQNLRNGSALESATEAGARPIYRECRRNLAADKGTMAFDGCGEFLSAGEVGSPDAFKCAACSCHRNFHRRLIDEQVEPGYVLHRHEATESEDSNLILTMKRLAIDVKAAISQVLPLLAEDLQKKGKERELFPSERSTVIKKCLEVLEHNAKLMLATTECMSCLQSGTNGVGREKSLQGLPALMTPGDASSDVKEGKFTSQALIPVRITGNSMHQISPLPQVRLPTNTHVQNREHNEKKRKRKRTKFTVEQLEKLHSFAERVKWTLSGLRKEDIESICSDIGIEAITLRYWLHNSKQKSRKKSCEEDGSCSRSPEHN